MIRFLPTVSLFTMMKFLVVATVEGWKSHVYLLHKLLRNHGSNNSVSGSAVHWIYWIIYWFTQSVRVSVWEEKNLNKFHRRLIHSRQSKKCIWSIYRNFVKTITVNSEGIGLMWFLCLLRYIFYFIPSLLQNIWSLLSDSWCINKESKAPDEAKL